MGKLPIARELTPAEITARRVILLPGLLEQAAERTPLPNGFRWRFITSGECLAAVAETINTERKCCRFLRFVVTVEPDEGPIWLEITGPPGTTEFLETLLCT
jgi:hypothetical protein